jgi:integrase/recombinase XerD
MSGLSSRIEQFLEQKQYIHNYSENTITWYRRSLAYLPSETPSQADLDRAIITMRKKTLKATGCNCRIRAINAYLHWLAAPKQKRCDRRVCSHLRIDQMKEPKEIMPTYTEDQVKAFIAYRAKRFYKKRLRLLALVMLDTGARITEALTLEVHEIDLKNCLLTLDGKGSKERIVPFSDALKKELTRYLEEAAPKTLLLATQDGASQLNRNNTLRDVKLLCKKLGFTAPKRALHAFRHTFAVNYLRRGGSVFHLQRILGHTTLEMTRRYANLLTEDLQVVHNKLSLLSN